MIKTHRKALFILPLLMVALQSAQMPSFAISDDQQLINQARESIEKLQYTKALYYIDCAERLNPKNRAIYYNRGRIYNKQEKYKEALEQFSLAIDLDPKYYSAIKKRAVVCIELKLYKNALADFERALSVEPNDPEIFAGRTRAYCDMGENKLALKDADKLIKLAPDRANFVVRGRIKISLHDYIGAIDDFTRASTFTKSDDEAYLLRAQCYEATGQDKLALADYSRIIAFNPKDEMAYQKRGDLFLKFGDCDKAVADYSNAIKFSPEKNAALYRARARAYRKVKRNDLAKKDESTAQQIAGQ